MSRETDLMSKYMSNEQLRDAILRRMVRHAHVFSYLDVYTPRCYREADKVAALWRRDCRRWRRAMRQGKWLPSGDMPKMRDRAMSSGARVLAFATDATIDTWAAVTTPSIPGQSTMLFDGQAEVYLSAAWVSTRSRAYMGEWSRICRTDGANALHMIHGARRAHGLTWTREPTGGWIGRSFKP